MKMKCSEMGEIFSLLRAIEQGGGRFIDHHSENMKTLKGVVIFKAPSGCLYLCQVIADTTVSLNPLGVEDDNLFLSTMSVGGLFTTGPLDQMKKEHYKGHGEVLEGFVLTKVNDEIKMKRVF